MSKGPGKWEERKAKRCHGREEPQDMAGNRQGEILSGGK